MNENLNGIDSVINTFNERQLRLRRILDVLMDCQTELDGWQLNPCDLSHDLVQFHHTDLDKRTGNPRLLAKKLGGIWYRHDDKWESLTTKIGHVVLHGAEHDFRRLEETNRVNLDDLTRPDGSLTACRAD